MEQIAVPNPSSSRTKFGKSGSFSSVKTELSPSPEAQPSRRRLPEDQKLRLLNLITKQNYNMKQASKIMSISYSTVKKIYTRFRKSLRKVPKEKAVKTLKDCPYREIPDGWGGIVPRIAVFSTIAGKEQKRNENIILILKKNS